MKSEFGLYKNDPNVKVFIPEETENFGDFSDDEVEKEQKRLKMKKSKI